MPQPPLKFLPKGTGMVQDYGQMRAGVRCFHGYKHDPTLGAKVPIFDDKGVPTGATGNRGAFVKQLGSESVVVVPFEDDHRGEYIRALRDGSLWPADEYTAQLAGLAFDKAFGGEHDDKAKAAQKAALDEARGVAAQPLPPAPPAPPTPSVVLKGS